MSEHPVSRPTRGTPPQVRRRPDPLPTRIVLSGLGIAASLGLVTVISPPAPSQAADSNPGTTPDGQVAGVVGGEQTQQVPGDSVAGVSEVAAPSAHPKASRAPGSKVTPRPTKQPSSGGATSAGPKPTFRATTTPGGTAPKATPKPTPAPTARATPAPTPRPTPPPTPKPTPKPTPVPTGASGKP